MSTWFSQTMIYGYQTTTDVFEKLTADTNDEDYDQLLAENNASGIGWVLTDDDIAIYGQIVLFGESYGNDTLFSAESGVIEIPFLSEQDASKVFMQIEGKMPFKVYENDVKYYIVGQYS